MELLSTSITFQRQYESRSLKGEILRPLKTSRDIDFPLAHLVLSASNAICVGRA